MDSAYFKTRYSPHPGREKVWKAICEYLQKFISPSSVVADIGAGYGDFINQIRARAKYAVDTTPEAAGSYAADVQFVRANPIETVDLPAGSIDVVMLSNLLEHLSPEQCNALFDRLERALTAAGRVIVVQPNYPYCSRHYWDDFTHVRAWSHISLKDFLVSRNFKIVTLEKRFLPFSFKSHLPKSYYATKLYLASFWRPGAAQMLIVAQR
jgi:ubiquinone/menaquinone biosynthesis C-methylase UbiE